MNFGDNLKKILDEKGISQRQFGFKVGGKMCIWVTVVDCFAILARGIMK